jgi:hypothetical protein
MSMYAEEAARERSEETDHMDIRDFLGDEDSSDMGVVVGGQCVVQFGNHELARRAMKVLNGLEIGGQRLVTGLALNYDEVRDMPADGR